MITVREVPYRVKFLPGLFDHCLGYAYSSGREYQWSHEYQEWYLTFVLMEMDKPTEDATDYAEVA